MTLLSLLKNRFLNRFTTTINALLLVVTMTMLIYSVSNILNGYGSFARNSDNIIGISLENLMNIDEISNVLKGYDERDRIKYIDYMLDSDFGIYYREYGSKDFLHEINLNNKKHQIILSDEYSGKYYIGDKFVFNNQNYDIVNFTTSGNSYCSKMGLDNLKISYISIEMEDLKKISEKENAKALYTKIFPTATFSFAGSGDGMFVLDGMKIGYLFFAIICIMIIIFFPYIENLKHEYRAMKLVGYSTMSFLILSALYQVLFSAASLAIAIIVNIFISPSLGVYLPKILLLIFALTVVDVLIITSSLLIKKRKII